jgi:hypothetical protein
VLFSLFLARLVAFEKQVSSGTDDFLKNLHANSLLDHYHRPWGIGAKQCQPFVPGEPQLQPRPRLNPEASPPGSPHRKKLGPLPSNNQHNLTSAGSTSTVPEPFWETVPSAPAPINPKTSPRDSPPQQLHSSLANRSFNHGRFNPNPSRPGSPHSKQKTPPPPNDQHNLTSA